MNCPPAPSGRIRAASGWGVAVGAIVSVVLGNAVGVTTECGDSEAVAPDAIVSVALGTAVGVSVGCGDSEAVAPGAIVSIALGDAVGVYGGSPVSVETSVSRTSI